MTSYSLPDHCLKSLNALSAHVERRMLTPYTLLRSCRDRSLDPRQKAILAECYIQLVVGAGRRNALYALVLHEHSRGNYALGWHGLANAFKEKICLLIEYGQSESKPDFDRECECLYDALNAFDICLPIELADTITRTSWGATSIGTLNSCMQTLAYTSCPEGLTEQFADKFGISLTYGQAY